MEQPLITVLCQGSERKLILSLEANKLNFTEKSGTVWLQNLIFTLLCIIVYFSTGECITFNAFFDANSKSRVFFSPPYFLSFKNNVLDRP